jgi:adenosylmethionine---8-amino-7-oxononanoate aminotransferase
MSTNDQALQAPDPVAGPASPGPASRAWLDRDLRSVWHPFTQHARWADDDPLVISAAQGMHLIDADGRRYLDANSSLWVNVHGHRVPELDQALAAQAARMSHTTFLGATHEPGIALAERLVELAPPGLTRAFFSSDGASSVEAALKMAFQSAAQRGQQRPLYVHVAQGYHGDTLGAVSVGGIDLFHATYRPILLDTVSISSPGELPAGTTRAERAGQVVAELDALLERIGHQVCAVIVEPMNQAAAGMLVHDASFLVGVRSLCDRSGALMIADEVATGVGRTGRMWAVEHAGVSPDLLTLGKGVTGGYLPLSAVLASEEVYEAFLGTPDSGRTFFHGHSFTANPLACAVALANLDLMAERGTVAHAARMGQRLGSLLASTEQLDGVVEIRRIGTMTGIELAPVPFLERAGFEVCRRMRHHGVLTRPLGDVVVLMPPLAMDDADLTTVVEVCQAAIAEVTG